MDAILCRTARRNPTWMKRSIILLGLSGTAHGSLISLGEHVDLRWRWDAVGGWTVMAVADSDPENPFDPAEFFLPLSDKPYHAGAPSNSGARFAQPASPSFAFTGVAAGEPLWIAVQGSPGMGEAWPGFENNQPANAFGSYIPDDSRLSQSLPGAYITITLDSYTPPLGTSAYFSMWSNFSGSPAKVWMSTYDASIDNKFYFTAGSHTHLNWGFSALGLHRVRLKASAFRGPGRSNPTGFSAVKTLTFAVGPFANWQATHFSSAELDDPSISGPHSDPDRDGMENLIEFGFGLDPRNGTTGSEVEGLGLPRLAVVEEDGVYYEVIEYPARRAAGQTRPIVYLPQFSSGLEGWNDLNVVITESDYLGSASYLNCIWQKVRARRVAEFVKPAAGFARVALTFNSVSVSTD